MIAYNHYIKFVPELKNDNKIEGSVVDTVTVQESVFERLEDRYEYELKFNTNQGRDLTLYTDSKSRLRSKGQFWAFDVKGIVTFFWNRGTLNIEYIKHDNYTEELLKYWCLHILLPLFFTIEEIFDFLHAGAVEVGGKPILFLAPSMGGKSTMTDYFMKQGHAMISDDKVATYEENGVFYAIPSYPYHRPYRKIEDMGYFVQNFIQKPKSSYVIYELEKAAADAKIMVKELKGVEKYKSLRYASEMNLFFLKQKRFEYLIKMANKISVYKIIVPWEIERLNEVYEIICEHRKDLE